ncbi:nitric oxide synthase oxygenase, partial [Bacillus pumilus]|uniref:nitric oxide synthase oxygenase n=1 Tax=Bacillus pumilus TaxID=1408 RepID=UPI0034D9565E
MQYPTNPPKIKPSITIFPPQNHSQNQLIIYNHHLLPYPPYHTHYPIIPHHASLQLTNLSQPHPSKPQPTHF